MLKKIFMSFVLLFSLITPYVSKTGVYDDVKRFVQTNGYYKALLSTVSVIYSYKVFDELIHINLPNLDHRVQKAGAVSGAAVILRLVDANPGYATITLLGLLMYNALKH